MREIRFRGRNKHTGLWHFGSLLNPTQGYHFPQIWDWHIDAPYPVLEETVGQLTGLFDKDGNEIYEGDILDGHDDGNVEVVWRDGETQFDFADGGNIGVWEMPLRRSIVIGNIYENPELLNND